MEDSHRSHSECQMVLETGRKPFMHGSRKTPDAQQSLGEDKQSFYPQRQSNMGYQRDIKTKTGVSS